MKKLFGRDKPKSGKPPSPPTPLAETPTPIHSVFASQGKQSSGQPGLLTKRPVAQHQHTNSRNSIRRSNSSSPERLAGVNPGSWEVIDDPSLPNPHSPNTNTSLSNSISSLPPGASPPTPSPLGGPNGYAEHKQQPQLPPQSISTPSNLRRKPPMASLALNPSPPPPLSNSSSSSKTTTVAALGILRALDPHGIPAPPQSQMPRPPLHSETRTRYSQSDTGHEYVNQDDRSSLQHEGGGKRKFWERTNKDRDAKMQHQERENLLRESAVRDRETRERENQRDREYREGKERELRQREMGMDAELRERERVQRERQELEQYYLEKERDLAAREKALRDAQTATGQQRGGESRTERESPAEDRRPSDREHVSATTRDRERERERDNHGDRERSSRHRDKEKEKAKPRDKERDEEGQELTRMIGYLTATASEDWTLVLEVCDRASVNETAAKEAVKALRREFKYGEPAAQLSAARLWAIMLRNSSTPFIAQSTSRKFLDTLEDLLTSSRTSPVVRERVLDVVAAAAFASQGATAGKNKGIGEREGFRGLWKRVKPADKPDEGMPFDTHDAMFNPPVSRISTSHDVTPPVDPADRQRSSTPDLSSSGTVKPRKHKSSKNRIIPVDEDIRRLFAECTIGSSNAQVLSEALTFATPEDLKKKPIITEFYTKSKASQDLILAQIPWATAGAARSRTEKDALDAAEAARKTALPQGKTPRPLSHAESPTEPITFASNPFAGDDDDVAVPELTKEEQLLAALFAAHEELESATRVYDDLYLLAEEKRAQNRSRKEIRMDRREMQGLQSDMEYLQVDGSSHAAATGSSRTPSPSPPPSPVTHTITAASPLAHPVPVMHSHMQIYGNNSNSPYVEPMANLAPPPPAPVGPRSPTLSATHSRTPSPSTPAQMFVPAHGHNNSNSNLNAHLGRLYHSHSRNSSIGTEDSSELLGSSNGFGPRSMNGGQGHGYASSNDYRGEEEDTRMQPSAKALGKRPAVAAEPEVPYDQDSLYDAEHREHYLLDDSIPEPDRDDDDSSTAGLDKQFNPSPRYIYDAAAERTQQRILEGQRLAAIHAAVPPPPPINGVLSH